MASSQTDDQVTSVTTSLGGQGDALSLDREDMIVSRPSMLPETARPAASGAIPNDTWDDSNLPAHEDQQDRVRVIARGNRNAIMRARERHALRRGQAVPEAQDADRIDATADENGDDGRPADTIAPSGFGDHGDGAFRPTHRASAGQRFDQSAPSPGFAHAAPPVPAHELGDRARQASIVSRRSDAERFDSVPHVRPDVALPRLREFLNASDADGGPDAEPLGDEAETSYDRVLRRAQSIKTEAARLDRTKSPGRRVPLQAHHPAPRHAPATDSTIVQPAPATDDADRLPAMVLADIDEPSVTADHGPVDDDATWLEAADDADTPFDDDQDGEFTYRHSPDSSPDNPQQSWWRGLTLGFGRRQPLAQDDELEWLDDEVDDAVGSQAGAWRERDRARPASDHGPEREFSFSGQQRWGEEPVSSERNPRAAEDELIDYELTDEVLETSFADDTDRIQFESWRDAPPPAPADEDAADPPASRFMLRNLRDREDMDAFRAALFGEEPVPEPAPPPVRDPRPGRRRSEPAPVPRTEVDPLHLAAEQPAKPVEPRPRRNEHVEFDIRDFVRQDAEPLDMSIQIAPEVPRACQTCRDFRPSESGERGWCTNDFAFAHRQMVNAGDLPCRSSIGCWWLPNDAAWLEGDDPAILDRATPRTDRMVARRLGREVGDNHADRELYVREM